MNCRFCGKELKSLFISLGSTALANSYLTKEQLTKKELSYPLDVYVCENCFLVQLPEFESPENIFSEYAYFSSYSDTWLKHAENYVEKMIKLFDISNKSYVVEIASNDGYLLQYFVEKGIPVLGIEPALNVAEAAKQKGIPTETVFFGTKTAEKMVKQGKYADLLIGNNVLAHVSNINDFVSGLKIVLNPEGIMTMEFPHLLQLIEGTQFDTIYHEHFSYFSFLTAERIFYEHNLTVFDVEELPTHGGSLRIYVKHKENKVRSISDRVIKLRKMECAAGYANLNHYFGFREKAEKIKKDIIEFFIRAKKDKKKIVGYGAAAKGNTLLNYCGINTDFLDYVVDKNPYKQGRYLPGSHILIEPPFKIKETKPDYLFILPWNLKDEIMEQMSYVHEWGGKFVIPIPEVTVI